MTTMASAHKGQKMLILNGDKEKEECCGCSACKSVCPVKAIKMTADEEGFSYPVIDNSVCISCGRCQKVCNFYYDPDKNARQAYGVKHKDLEIRTSSRSGGAFPAFCKYVVSKGGSVYGAVMKDDFSVCHVRSDTLEDCQPMKKAKYVQSSTEGIFPLIEKDLKDGRTVLFSGTPCQVASVYGYLEMKKLSEDNLLTCDLICHGVPSPDLWQQYVRYIIAKEGQPILEIQFRDKDCGWSPHFESYILADGRKRFARDYTNLFYKHIIFRPSCASCPFANLHRPGDITIGDFWGIEKQNAAFNDEKGVSLIFINTKKGKHLFDNIKDDYIYFETEPSKCLQPTLIRPSKVPPEREQFWADYKRMPFRKLIQKYTVPKSILKRCRYYAKRILYKCGLRQVP